MYKLTKSILAISLAILAAMVAGCASDRKPLDLSGYVWPRPPEPAKMKLIKTITTDLDVQSNSSFDAMFGEEYTFRFVRPHGIAADDKGNIYVSDTQLHKVAVINLKRNSIDFLSHPYGWKTPMSIAVDLTNRLLAVADAGAGSVYIFDLDSSKLKYITAKGKLKNPIGVALDPVRKLMYVSDSKLQGIFTFDDKGVYVGQLAGGGVDVGQIHFPTGIALDKDGNIYVVDTMNFRIQVISPDGKTSRAFSQHGDTPGSVARPKGISISDDGYVFVTDAAFGNFQVFDSKGLVYLFVGATGEGVGLFRIPEDIFVDHDDKVYIADSINGRIQIYQYLSDRYKKSHPDDPALHPADKAAETPVEKPKTEQPAK